MGLMGWFNMSTLVTSAEQEPTTQELRSPALNDNPSDRLCGNVFLLHAMAAVTCCTHSPITGSPAVPLSGADTARHPVMGIHVLEAHVAHG
jgi:hypothetical protein